MKGFIRGVFGGAAAGIAYALDSRSGLGKCEACETLAAMAAAAQQREELAHDEATRQQARAEAAEAAARALERDVSELERAVVEAEMRALGAAGERDEARARVEQLERLHGGFEETEETDTDGTAH